jgi:hypothetical protein
MYSAAGMQACHVLCQQFALSAECLQSMACFTGLLACSICHAQHMASGEIWLLQTSEYVDRGFANCTTVCLCTVPDLPSGCISCQRRQGALWCVSVYLMALCMLKDQCSLTGCFFKRAPLSEGFRSGATLAFDLGLVKRKLWTQQKLGPRARAAGQLIFEVDSILIMAWEQHRV